MKVALLSDIHSNLEAFIAVKQSLSDYGAGKILFLGDIVGYGANPNECIELLRALTDCNIAGNHDFAAVGKTDITYFNEYARTAVIWTENQLTNKNVLFLSSLPLSREMDNFLYVHSTPHHPEKWDYILTLSAASESFRHLSQSICFVGHSHNPVIMVQDKAGNISVITRTDMTVQKDQRYIINIGSVGQPRDGDPRASYGLYDTAKKHYSLIRVAYDIAAAQKKIINAGLPGFLATRLEGGH